MFEAGVPLTSKLQSANRITTLMTTAAAVKVMQKKSFCADPLSQADKVVTAAITASGNVDRVSF